MPGMRVWMIPRAQKREEKGKEERGSGKTDS